MESRLPGEGASGPPPLTKVLEGLPADQSVTLAEFISVFGSRAHGGALFLLGLPDCLPLPIPSASAILAVPLVVISADLAIHGDGGTLPRRIGAWRVPKRLIAAIAEYLPPLLARVERLSRPRWAGIAKRERLLGMVALYLSLLLLAPLPFFNTPPSVCLVLLAWGMVQRDGVFVAAGLVGTAAVTAALIFAGVWARTLLT